MSMLELISKASATSDQLSPDSQYPIVLNPDPILLNLKPQIQQQNDQSFVKRVQGWAISQKDTEAINLRQKFIKELKIKLKNPNSFNKDDFLSFLTSYLEKNSQISGISFGLKSKDEAYTKMMIKSLGFMMGDAVIGPVLEACFTFEIWGIMETLIVGGLVDGPSSNGLVQKLVDKNRSDLVCLCVKHVSNLPVSDILSVLKYFLSPSKDAYSTMTVIRKEWESRAVSAIETAMDKKSKDAAVLLTMAHDEFTTSELCLHYLIASPNVDDVVFSACVGKLNGTEIMGFVRYLNKWLVKYQKYPQVGSFLEGSVIHGLKVIESVPSLENVSKCFGLVVDEHFSSLVMHPEFRVEVESIGLVVNSLASEARVCCSLANLCVGLGIEGLETEG